MFRMKLLLSGRPLILCSYIGGVYNRRFDKLRRSWERTGEWFLYPSFPLSFLKHAYTTFSSKGGIRAALKSHLEFSHLTFNRLRRNDFASLIPHDKIIRPRWPGEFKQLPMVLRAAGSKAWSWRMKAALPVVGLAIFAFWGGSLVREFSIVPPPLGRQLMPPEAADPETDLMGWVDVPRPMIVIRPEVVHEPNPVTGASQPILAPTPSVPKLSLTQIFARLDRGEITLAETKALLAAKSSESRLERSRN